MILIISLYLLLLRIIKYPYDLIILRKILLERGMRPTRVTYWHELNCNLSGAMLSCWRFWWRSDYLDVVVPPLLGDQALAPTAWDDLFNDDEAYLRQTFYLGNIQWSSISRKTSRSRSRGGVNRSRSSRSSRRHQ